MWDNFYRTVVLKTLIAEDADGRGLKLARNGICLKYRRVLHVIAAAALFHHGP